METIEADQFSDEAIKAKLEFVRENFWHPGVVTSAPAGYVIGVVSEIGHFETSRRMQYDDEGSGWGFIGRSIRMDTLESPAVYLAKEIVSDFNIRAVSPDDSSCCLLDEPRDYCFVLLQEDELPSNRVNPLAVS